MDKEEYLVENLERLKVKLLKLTEAYREAMKTIDSLQTENKELNSVISGLNERLEKFQNQQKISKIVTSVADDAQESTALKLKINEYIKEIDKCIAHLSE